MLAVASWGRWKILVRVYVTDEKFVVFGPVWFVCVFHNVELSALGFVAFFQLCQTHSVALSLCPRVFGGTVLYGVVLKGDSLSGPWPGCRLRSIIWAAREALCL